MAYFIDNDRLVFYVQDPYDPITYPDFWKSDTLRDILLHASEHIPDCKYVERFSITTLDGSKQLRVANGTGHERYFSMQQHGVVLYTTAELKIISRVINELVCKHIGYDSLTTYLSYCQQFPTSDSSE
jgi:hypothetical protein